MRSKKTRRKEEEREERDIYTNGEEASSHFGANFDIPNPNEADVLNEMYARQLQKPRQSVISLNSLNLGRRR